MNHRVFRSPVQFTEDAGFDDLRCFFRSLGLAERASGDCYLYEFPHPAGAPRHFATVRCRIRYVTVYLYPDALGRDAGHASRFYRTLDDSGFGMGSKLGPSIDFSLDNAARLRQFKQELALLFAP